MSYYQLKTLLILTILANSFAYDQQRTLNTTLTSGSFSLFAYLFVGEIILTVLFKSLTYYLTPLSSLLQTVVFYLTQYSPAAHTTSTHYL